MNMSLADAERVLPKTVITALQTKKYEYSFYNYPSDTKIHTIRFTKSDKSSNIYRVVVIHLDAKNVILEGLVYDKNADIVAIQEYKVFIGVINILAKDLVNSVNTIISKLDKYSV